MVYNFLGLGIGSSDLLQFMLTSKGGLAHGMNPFLAKKLFCTEVNGGDCTVPNSSTGKTCGRNAVSTSDSDSNVTMCCRCKTVDL